MSNRPWIDPRLIDWSDGLNPLKIPAFRPDANPFVYASLQEDITQQLRAAKGRMTVSAAPDDQSAIIPALATFEQTLVLGGVSWLIGFSAHSQQPEGFMGQATVTSTGEPIWSQPLWSKNISGRPIGFLAMPHLLDPGQLTLRLLNLSAAPNRCQLCAWTIEEAL